MSKHIPTRSAPTGAGRPHPGGALTNCSDEIMDAQALAMDLRKAAAWCTHLADKVQESLRNAQLILQPRLAKSA